MANKLKLKDWKMLELIMIAVGLYIAYTVVKSKNANELADEATQGGVNMFKVFNNVSKMAVIKSEDGVIEVKIDSEINRINSNVKLDKLATERVKSTNDNNEGLTKEQITAKEKLLDEINKRIYN